MSDYQTPRSSALLRFGWFAFLWFSVCLVVVSASLYSDQLPSDSPPRHGFSAILESAAQFIVTFIVRPFAPLVRVFSPKIAGHLIVLFWATAFYCLSAVVRRPKWVFPR
jgi:hypothetical protein